MLDPHNDMNQDIQPWQIKARARKPYTYEKRTESKKARNDDAFRKKMAKTIASMDKSTRLDPALVPATFLDIPCVEKEFTVPSLDERNLRRKEFEFGVRADFIKHLAKTQRKELLATGISVGQINGMKNGYTPKGFNTHHMVPLHGGGSNDFSNLVLIKCIPYHNMLHYEVINPQVRGIKEGETLKVKIPFTDAKVYVPDARFIEMERKAEEIATEKRKINAAKKKLKHMTKVKAKEIKAQNVYAFVKKNKGR